MAPMTASQRLNRANTICRMLHSGKSYDDISAAVNITPERLPSTLRGDLERAVDQCEGREKAHAQSLLGRCLWLGIEPFPTDRDAAYVHLRESAKTRTADMSYVLKHLQQKGRTLEMNEEMTKLYKRLSRRDTQVTEAVMRTLYDCFIVTKHVETMRFIIRHGLFGWEQRNAVIDDIVQTCVGKALIHKDPEGVMLEALACVFNNRSPVTGLVLLEHHSGQFPTQYAWAQLAVAHLRNPDDGATVSAFQHFVRSVNDVWLLKLTMSFFTPKNTPEVKALVQQIIRKIRPWNMSPLTRTVHLTRFSIENPEERVFLQEMRLMLLKRAKVKRKPLDTELMFEAAATAWIYFAEGELTSPMQRLLQAAGFASTAEMLKEAATRQLPPALELQRFIDTRHDGLWVNNADADARFSIYKQIKEGVCAEHIEEPESPVPQAEPESSASSASPMNSPGRRFKPRISLPLDEINNIQHGREHEAPLSTPVNNQRQRVA